VKINGALVITGPTASGKSALALNIAREFSAEIVSADSAQVYRGMDIGTAKPDLATQAEVPHHLIDIRDPIDPYSAADFRSQAIQVVSDIQSRGRLPIITGGTMLYLKALKEGLADLPEGDEAVRLDITETANKEGWEVLHEELQRVDPVAAERIRPSDTQRLQRALEVFRLTGVPLTEHHLKSVVPCPFRLLEIAIVPSDRSELHRAITGRFDAMLEMGFVEEVSRLLENPELTPDLPALRAVGYRQIWRYLNGDVLFDEMRDTAIAATRQLAKRQFTWLRSWQDLHCLDQPNTARALKILTTSTILG
jgi:tRNA dimethylallyltransferase